MLDLHNKVRQLAVERTVKVGFMKRAKWALFEKERLRRLLEDVDESVDYLLALFPAGRTVQEKLCKSEVSFLSQNKGVYLLQNIAAEQDRLLEAVLKRTKLLQ
ncbi:hypothetical protein EJ02DRAFT_80769 [Clathrospora elynae]|uniref:Prion-inhibition and propagation HeLo domain-containing protein n=1 Tax=Clathrospora elynae TaxID=706981 RepID=A0A6A5S984_9PLEO|nr:hypothetical protein EJ02DRAFT_80769 [Clathrospora elynae]